MSGSNQSRQAVNCTVTRQNKRFGSYPGGYQIINQSLYTTVWASDNPGGAPNQGTPISPGTSIVWASDGDIFLVVGNDATSVDPLLGNSTALCVLTYDVQNWQPNPVAVAAAVLNSGVIVVDNPVALIADGNKPIGYLSPTIDVSRFQSIALSIQGNAFPPYAVNVTFYATALGTQPLATYQINSGQIGTSVRHTQAFNVVGAFVVVQIVSSTGPINVSMFGSFRRLTTDALTYVGAPTSTYSKLYSERYPAIGAGAAGPLEQFFIPYYGVATVFIFAINGGVIAANTHFGQFVYGIGGFSTDLQDFRFFSLTSPPYATSQAGWEFDMPIWGTTPICQINNTTANVCEYRIVVYPKRAMN